KEPVETVQMMKLNLCYVMIDSDGSVIRKEVIKEFPKNSSPLTTAINNLLSGPSADEVEKGYMSLIPEGTKLLGARVANKTATLNFSESFSFNRYGVQGYLGQLMQIVYTATSFSTIDNVQFLIEGQKLEYLGGEGVWIGSPLSRISFK
ncbi:MAG: GerMN domain-containing protein, partial [Spirochaetaceae bacterium]|nr:GerMN domain-containing protein [Spirochaetaceae bacterium]